MSASRADSDSTAFDTAKLVLAVGVFLAGVVAFYYFDEQSTLYRVLGLVGVAAVAVVITMTSTPGQNAWGFARESRIELRKVIWPTRQEALQTTLIVLVMVFIVAILLWLLDMFFLWGVETLLSLGG